MNSERMIDALAVAAEEHRRRSEQSQENVETHRIRDKPPLNIPVRIRFATTSADGDNVDDSHEISKSLPGIPVLLSQVPSMDCLLQFLETYLSTTLAYYRLTLRDLHCFQFFVATPKLIGLKPFYHPWDWQSNLSVITRYHHSASECQMILPCNGCQNVPVLRIYFTREKLRSALRSRNMEISQDCLVFLDPQHENHTQRLRRYDPEGSAIYTNICEAAVEARRERRIHVIRDVLEDPVHVSEDQTPGPSIIQSIGGAGDKIDVSQAEQEVLVGQYIGARPLQTSLLNQPVGRNSKIPRSWLSADTDAEEPTTAAKTALPEPPPQIPFVSYFNGIKESEQPSRAPSKGDVDDTTLASTNEVRSSDNLQKEEDDRCLTCLSRGLACRGTQLVEFRGNSNDIRCLACAGMRPSQGTRKCYWKNPDSNIFTYDEAKAADPHAHYRRRRVEVSTGQDTTRTARTAAEHQQPAETVLPSIETGDDIDNVKKEM